MNNKLSLSSSMIPIFLHGPVDMRKNWPSLIHLQTIEPYVPPSFMLLLPCQTFCAYISIVSQSDCYVSLWLPTASDEKFQTKTIKNCRDPVWNETFYFWIQRKVKVPKALISACSLFWFKPKQDVNTSSTNLSLLKVLASWSEPLWLLPLPSSWMLFVYQQLSLTCLQKAERTNGRVALQRNNGVDLQSSLRAEKPLFHWEDRK